MIEDMIVVPDVHGYSNDRDRKTGTNSISSETVGVHGTGKYYFTVRCQ